MRVIRTIRDMQRQSRDWKRQKKTVALVPTMGCLHDGHLSLVRKARQIADIVVVSIFVNPTQFGPKEDFSKYPRTWDEDREACERGGADAIFFPEAEDMYPKGASTWVVEEELTVPLCGERRPGHFRGVTTVVAKLFNAVLPDFAIFGQKDAQQALVIRRMTRDLNFPVDILVEPIVREKDGLAMSSRNRYLSEDERHRALSIQRGLQKAEKAWAAGERNSTTLITLVKAEIEAAQGRIDYVELRDAESLVLLEKPQGSALIAVAAFFGATRLLDNLVLS